METATSLPAAELKKQFDELGYCLVPDLFLETELREIEAFFEEFKHKGGKVFDAGATYEEVDPAQQQLRAMHPHRYSDRAQAWLLNPRVAEILEILLGEAPLAAQSMYYFKPPGGKGQGMHQDNFYLLAKPATCIAAWTAIDAATLDNGCLWVVPRSHRGGIHCPESSEAPRWMNYGDSHITKFPRDQKPIPVEVPRGWTLFFGGNLIHGSGPNRTRDRYRRTFIGHYINEASEQVARFYHPVLNMQGETVSVPIPEGGGPCGDGWLGAVH
jgi:hypothetical protein